MNHLHCTKSHKIDGREWGCASGIDQLIRKAIGVPDFDCETFYSHAYSLYEAKQCIEAAELFQILCARSPLDFRFWFGLGASMQEIHDFEKALHAWAMAAILDSKNPYPHFHAALCSHALGRMNDAILALKEAEIRAPDSLQGTICLLRQQWRIHDSR